MSKNKLLVIDDDLGFSMMVADYFKAHGYETYTADTLDEAIKIYKRRRPKVVLLDFSMPLVTGEKFLPLLQEIDPKVRAIVVTGCVGEEVEEKFKGLGYFAYLEKGGMSLEDLEQKVEEALNY
jgi:DNA-binding NtrC family response regulator